MKNAKKFIVPAIALLLVTVLCFSACDLNIAIDPAAGTSEAVPGTTSAPGTDSETGTSPSDTTGVPGTSEAPVTTENPVTTEVSGTEPVPSGSESVPVSKPMPTGTELTNAVHFLFDSTGFNGILFTEFDDVKDVNLWQVVAQIGESRDGMEAIYSKYGVTYSPYTGCKTVTSAVLAEKMQLWTGKGLDAFTKNFGDQNPIFFKNEGLYSVQFGGVEFNPVKIISATSDGKDLVTVVYTSSGMMSEDWIVKYDANSAGKAASMTATLRWTGDHFVIIDNHKVPAVPGSDIPTGTALIEALDKLFNTPGFNGLLFTDFTNITDANKWQVVAQIQDDSFTGNIKEEYIQHGFDYFDDTGCNVVSAKVLSESLKLWTDIDDPEAFAGYVTYMLVTDIYAVQFGGVEINPVKIIDARYDAADGKIYVRYTANGLVSDNWFTKYGNYIGFADEMLASLSYIDGRFVLVSNQVLWNNTDKNNFPNYLKTRTQTSLMVKGFNGILHSIFTADKITTLSMWDVVSQYDDVYEGDIAAAYKAAGLEYSADIDTKIVFPQHLADDIYGFTGCDLSDHLANTSKQPDVLGAAGLFAAQRGDVYHFLAKIHDISYDNGVYYIIITNGEDLESARCVEATLRWDGTFRIISNTVSPLGAPDVDPGTRLYPFWKMSGNYFTDPYVPTVTFNEDGTFVYYENCLAGMFNITGTYTEYADAIVCSITQSVPNGFAGDDLKSMTFEKDDTHLVLKTDICGSRSGSVFLPMIGQG